MRKTLTTLLAAFACATSIAQAEGKTVTANFTYDGALLATEAGAKAVLKSINIQAIEACAFKKPVSGAPSFDRACRDDLVDQAITKISVAAAASGQKATYVFASVDTDVVLDR